MYNFAPAAPDEGTVFGACRPAHPRVAPTDDSPADWVSFVRGEGIERVCCLLDDQHLRAYDDLLGTYRRAFGADRVCHAPVEDFSAIGERTWCERVRPFLEAADDAGEPAVVHCSAGSGRTGHVLVLWLVHARDYDLEDAVRTVTATGRQPLEAVSREQLGAYDCEP